MWVTPNIQKTTQCKQKNKTTATTNQQNPPRNMFACAEYICIYFYLQPRQGHLNSACSTEIQTLMLASPLVYRRWVVLLLTMPLNLKSLQACNNAKLGVQAPECFRKGVRRAGRSPTSHVLTVGKKLALFPWKKSEKNHPERYRRWEFHTDL